MSLMPLPQDRHTNQITSEVAVACRSAAVVVCFHPDHQKLCCLLEAIAPSVSRIIVFDNGGLNTQRLPSVNVEVHLVSQGGNVGIAAALNAGCQLASEQGEHYVITFDQDSLPEPGMIELLMQELLHFQAQGEPVAAIGPQIVDVRESAVAVDDGAQPRALANEPGEAIRVQPADLLITSGCLLDLSVWRQVPFDSRLFIDSVDFNWCWRLARAGYRCLKVNTARLQHELSDGVVHWRYITLTRHSPIRRYYQCRNAVYQLLYVSIPWSGKCFLLRDVIRSIIAAAWIDKARAKALWLCLLGCMHGLMGRLGPA